jgi:hypothetical protein
MALPFGAQPSLEPSGGTVSKSPSTSLLRCGFLLPRGVGGSPLSSAKSMGVKMRGVGAPPRLGGSSLLSSFLEMGESSREDVFEGVGGSPRAAIDVFCFHILGSYEGHVRGFLDLLAQIDVAQHQEVSVSTPKFKGSREVKNLVCLINYDARAKGKVPLLWCNGLWVLSAGSYWGVWVSFCF